MQKGRLNFKLSEIHEIEVLIKELEKASSDKQKGIRSKLRKRGLYWSEFAQGYAYTLANFRMFIKQGMISVDNPNIKKAEVPSPTNSSIKIEQEELGDQRIECFPPVVDSESEILILGTMPGADSLRKSEYYANPRNSFWKIISAIYNDGKGFNSYEEKLSCLQKNHLALWDVYSNCKRSGSLDADIEQPIPNNLKEFLESHPSIKKVILNGREAESAFTLLFPHEYAGSTSPANAKSLEAKIAEWRLKLAL